MCHKHVFNILFMEASCVKIDQTATNFSKNICHIVFVDGFWWLFFLLLQFWSVFFSPGFHVWEAAGLDP